jgi:hypothetical protein
VRLIPVATRGGISETAIPIPVRAPPTFERIIPYAAINPAIRAINVAIYKFDSKEINIELTFKCPKKKVIIEAPIIPIIRATINMPIERAINFMSLTTIPRPRAKIGYASGATIMLAISTAMLSRKMPEIASRVAPIRRR